MALRVIHLNCGSCCPSAGRLAGATAGEPARLVCRCLLIETDAGLVLVDTGFGVGQIERRWQGVGALTLAALRPQLRFEETALHQVQALGYQPGDVRHIVVTHLDLDHSGGIADFPEAQIHVMREEVDGALAGRTLAAMRRHPLLFVHPAFFAQRYRPAVWAHGPRWQVHEADAGETWRGLPGVRAIPGLPPELLLVPLPGHTFGHMGVAVESEDGWMLHAGDAYFHRGQIDRSCPRDVPLGYRLFTVIDSLDPWRVVATRRHLTAMLRRHRDVDVVSSHDPWEFDEVPEPRPGQPQMSSVSSPRS